jgi:hypothetical protein
MEAGWSGFSVTLLCWAALSGCLYPEMQDEARSSPSPKGGMQHCLTTCFQWRRPLPTSFQDVTWWVVACNLQLVTNAGESSDWHRDFDVSLPRCLAVLAATWNVKDLGARLRCIKALPDYLVPSGWPVTKISEMVHQAGGGDHAATIYSSPHCKLILGSEVFGWATSSGVPKLRFPGQQASGSFRRMRHSTDARSCNRGDVATTCSSQ